MENRNDLLNYLTGHVSGQEITRIEDRIMLDPAFRSEMEDAKLELFIRYEAEVKEHQALSQEEMRFFRQRISSDEIFQQKANAILNQLITEGAIGKDMTFSRFIRQINRKEEAAGDADGHIVPDLNEHEEQQEYLLSELKSSISKLKTAYDVPDVDTTTHPVQQVKETRLTRWAVAASIALLLGVGSYILVNDKGSQPDYFSDYYTPYELKPNKIDDQQAYADAFKHYTEGDYEQAQEQLARVLTDENKFLTAMFYLGMSSIETGDQELAKATLKKVSESNSIHFIDAKWYLALCYIRDDQTKQAKPLLKDIIDQGNSEYRDEAVALLKSLS